MGVIATQDEVFKIPPNTFGYRSFFVPSGLGDIISLALSDLRQSVGGVLFEQGELRIYSNNAPSKINFWVDSNGSFFLDYNGAGAYTIEDGNLIYTT